jgi:hypothetical protein
MNETDAARVETKTVFFHFREKQKSCENGVIFAKFREISFRENFRFRESFRKNFHLRENFRFNFRFRENFRKKFLPKNCEKVCSKYDYAKK